MKINPYSVKLNHQKNEAIGDQTKTFALSNTGYKLYLNTLKAYSFDLSFERNCHYKIQPTYDQSAWRESR